MTQHDDGRDGWHELEASATPLPARSRLGAGWWWVLRLLLPAALTSALVLEYAFLVDDGCTVAAPCLPAPGWSLLEGAQVGATAAVWLVSGAGLLLAGLVAVAYAVDYAVAGDLGTVSGLAGLAQVGVCVVGAAVFLRLRRRSLPRAATGRLPVRGREVLASRGLGTVELASVLAVVGAVGLLGWFAHLQAGTGSHLARAQPIEVEVVSVDDEDWVVEVRAPGTSGVSQVGVYDIEAYAVGDLVPARVDVSVEPAWVSLDAEPVEHDGWLVLAGALAALAVAVGAERTSALRRRRLLLTEGGPVWSTTAAPGADGSRVLLPQLGLRAPLVRRLPPDEVLEDLGILRHEVTADPLGRDPVEEADEDDEEADDADRARQEEFAAAWRGELSVGASALDDDLVGPADEGPVVLLGDPRPGGVVVVVTPEVVLAPHGSLQPMSPLDLRHHRSSADVGDGSGPFEDGGEADDGFDAAGLPGVVAVPVATGAQPRGADGRRVVEVRLAAPWWRRLAAVALLLLPAAFWLTADGSLPLEEQLTWFQSVGVLVGAGSLAFGGLALARSSTVLRPDGVHLAANGFVTVHPWSAAAGVRVIGDDVVVAFGVDDDGDLDAIGGPPVGLPVASAAGLAERWRLDAGVAVPDGGPTRRTVDPVVGGGVVLYALLAGASVLWPLLPAAL